MKKNIEKPPKEISYTVYTYLPTPFLFFFLPELLAIYYFVENSSKSGYYGALGQISKLFPTWP